MQINMSTLVVGQYYHLASLQLSEYFQTEYEGGRI